MDGYRSKFILIKMKYLKTFSEINESQDSNRTIINNLEIGTYKFEIFTLGDTWGIKMYNLDTGKDTEIKTFCYRGNCSENMNRQLLEDWNENKISKYDYGDLQVINKPNHFLVYFDIEEPIIDLRDDYKILELNEFIEQTLK